MTDEDATIIHSIPFDRTERIGIFPGFDYDNFPFVMRHHFQMNNPLTSKTMDGEYKGWRSHHLRITQNGEIEGINNVLP